MRYAVLAAASIYGVELLADNAEECRKRLFALWDKEYTAVCKKEANDETREAVRYILSKNILCGNALTLMCVDEEQNDTDKPIIFPEWSLLGTKLKRRDFRLDVMLKVGDDPKTGQPSMFKDGVDDYLSVNPVTGELMADPICEYPPIFFRKVQENG